MHRVNQRDVAICTTGATTIQLLDEHMRLFGLQMNNWDSFSRTIRVVDRISAAVMAMDAILAILTWSTVFVLVIPITVILLTWLARLFVSIRHRKVDRDLEVQKKNLEGKIEEATKSLGHKPLSAKVCFYRRPKRPWARELVYSPWSDYGYSYYWR